MLNPQSQQVVYDDEIDLIELIQAFWRKKWLIILCGVLGALLAMTYALNTKEVWKSVAEVTSPRAQKIQKYLDRIYKLDKITSENEQEMKSNQSKTNQKIEEIFDEFMFTAANQVNQKSFLEQTAYYKNNIEEGTLNSQSKLQNMLNNLKVEVPDEEVKTLRITYTLSFEADTSQDAQQILENYIKNSADIALKNLNKDLFNKIETAILWREEEIARFNYQLEQEKREQIKQYKEALAKAKHAGITEYLSSSSVPRISAINEDGGKARIDISQDQNLYMQGERILNALIEVSEQSDLSYPQEYYQLEYDIERLKALKTEIKNIDVFEYQMKPTYPLSREKPQRGLIVVAGGLVGGILGIFWTLLTILFKYHRKQRNESV